MSPVKRFSKTDIIDPLMHNSNSIIRINFALLELAIRENDDTGKIMKLYNACQKYFTGDIPINHTDRSISKNILNEKLEQIKVLTICMIQTRRGFRLTMEHISSRR